ncbi:MAG: hypothetical protein ABF290_05815, partial [Thiogranum sp.]
SCSLFLTELTQSNACARADIDLNNSDLSFLYDYSLRGVFPANDTAACSEPIKRNLLAFLCHSLTTLQNLR